MIYLFFLDVSALVFFFSPKIEETVHVTVKIKEFRITFSGYILNDLNLLTRYQFINVPPPPNSATHC